MAKPKNGESAMKYRLVVLTTEEKAQNYDKMMTAIGENRSEHIRNLMDAEYELWENAQK